MKEVYWTLGCPHCETGFLFGEENGVRSIVIFPNKEMAQIEASSIDGETVPVVQISIERLNSLHESIEPDIIIPE